MPPSLRLQQLYCILLFGGSLHLATERFKDAAQFSSLTCGLVLGSLRHLILIKRRATIRLKKSLPNPRLKLFNRRMSTQTAAINAHNMLTGLGPALS